LLLISSEIRFVSTNGEQPTPNNSEDFTEGDDLGRGSFVFFNQASMFCGPETGYDTLEAARESGLEGTSNYLQTAQQAFTNATKYFSISNLWIEQALSLYWKFFVNFEIVTVEDRNSLSIYHLDSHLRLYTYHSDRNNLSRYHWDKHSFSTYHLDKTSLSIYHLGKQSLSIYHLGKQSLSIYHLDKSRTQTYHLDENSSSSYHLVKKSLSTYHLDRSSFSMYHFGEKSLSIYHLDKSSIQTYHLDKNTYHLGRKSVSTCHLDWSSPSTYHLDKICSSMYHSESI
jgi:hypothetical protein